MIKGKGGNVQEKTDRKPAKREGERGKGGGGGGGRREEGGGWGRHRKRGAAESTAPRRERGKGGGREGGEKRVWAANRAKEGG